MPRPLVFRFTLSGPGCLASSEAGLESPGFLTHPSVHLQACTSMSPISAGLDLDSGSEPRSGELSMVAQTDGRPGHPAQPHVCGAKFGPIGWCPPGDTRQAGHVTRAGQPPTGAQVARWPHFQWLAQLPVTCGVYGLSGYERVT